MFIPEQKDNRWHLHGVVAYPQDRREELRQALKGIAGKSGSPYIDGKAAHLQDIDEMKSYGGQSGLDGWALYFGKGLSQSSRVLTKSPVMSSQPLKALVRGV